MAAVHSEKTNTAEPDHIIIIYKAKNNVISSPEGRAWHVYTRFTTGHSTAISTSFDTGTSTTSTEHTCSGAGTSK
jgi:hypothetical protein